MSDKLKIYISTWLEKANEDLLVAVTLLELKVPLPNPTCFHLQQAVEKFLKAFLIFHSVDFEKTHNLNLLLSDCQKLDKEFLEIDIGDLSDFAVSARYQDDMFVASVKEAKDYAEITRQIKKLVEGKIRLA